MVFDYEGFKKSKIKNLTIDNNPLTCNCPLFKFIGSNKNILHDFSNITCLMNKKFKNVLEFQKAEICPSKIDFIVIGSSVIAFLGLFFGLLFALYFRYTLEIKIFLYSRNLCLWWVTEEEFERRKIYDIFLSFCHADEEFVLNDLLPYLENRENPFTTYIHSRDWLAGEWIPDCIRRSVELSRRTVIVLSRSFLRSQWAMMEFRTAYDYMLQRRTKIITIMLEDIESIEDLDSEVKNYLNNHVCIRWGDARFWEKLFYALPHSIQRSATTEL